MADADFIARVKLDLSGVEEPLKNLQTRVQSVVGGKSISPSIVDVAPIKDDPSNEFYYLEAPYEINEVYDVSDFRHGWLHLSPPNHVCPTLMPKEVTLL